MRARVTNYDPPSTTSSRTSTKVLVLVLVRVLALGLATRFGAPRGRLRLFRVCRLVLVRGLVAASSTGNN